MQDKALRKFRLKIAIILTVLYLLVGLVSMAAFKHIAPQHYFEFYPAISAFYWLCGIMLNNRLEHYHLAKPDKLLNVFMMVRLVKFLLTIGFLFLGIKVVGVPRVPFIVALMANYFLSTILEIYIYYIYSKQIAKTGNGSK